MIVGLGIDLVEVARVERMLDSLGDRAYARLFTDAEASYIRSRALSAQHAAVRLAAKEAAFKALAGSERARQIGWRDAEVIRGWDGAPAIALHGVARERADELGVTSILLSLTHTSTTAAAVVVMEGDRRS
jgi:holo-[acyl-carrier protein] synthase